MTIVFLSLLAVVSILLVIIIFLQSGKVKNIGSSIVGTQNIELFENTKRRGKDVFLYWSTWVFVILFFTFAIVLLII